ncbi:MAG: type III pantothenate kinase [Muribaculaceae bacterium]|nr:type III pantothenate kinase [Muribaculaceae bacterium]
MEGGFLAIDGGNSRLKATLFPKADGEPEVKIFDSDDTDDLLAYISDCGAASGAMACVSHVDPRLLETLRLVFRERFLAVTPSTELPIGVSYPRPETLGIDRKATAVAAHDLYPCERSLVIDAGSAVTCDVVGPEGFIRGSISPGLSMRLRALHEFTARLPQVARPVAGEALPEWARTTEGAILSGVAAGFLNEVLADIVNLGAGVYGAVRVLLTGGDAAYILNGLPRLPLLAAQREALEKISIVHEPHLLAKGVRAIYIHHENEYK